MDLRKLFRSFFETCALPSKFILSRSMQRRDSLGATTTVPRLNTGSTQKFKTWRSQSMFGSVSDVFAEDRATKGQVGLSVSGRKLRSKKNLDDIQGRSGETGH